MPTVKVYRGEKLIDTLNFSRTFSIMESTEAGLTWGTEHDRLGGEFQVWLTTRALMLVQPNWNLRVDGQTLKNELYIDLEIAWRKIELSYLDYRFLLEQTG